MLDSMDQTHPKRKLRRILLRCSSWQLAAILLIALAAVFTGFWFESSSPWWLLLLTSVLSLALISALIRVSPLMWRDMMYYRRLRHPESMPSMSHHAVWRARQSVQLLADRYQSVLNRHGYAVRRIQNNDGVMLGATKGRLNRTGFVLIHIAAVMIIFAAVLDSDIGLRYLLWRGVLLGEPRDIPVNEIARQSSIGSGSGLAYQAEIKLRPGQMSDEARVRTDAGFLAKHLPYAVAVNSVELDTAHLLQENNFLTHITVLDSRLNNPVQTALGNNQAFHYRGLDFYQRGLEDGGSDLTVAMWPLAHVRSTPLKIRTQVSAERELQTRQGTIRIFFSDLNPRNIMPMQTDSARTSEYKNIGPSLHYRVNDEQLREREFINYMLPILQDGRYFYISGIRESDTGPFRFIHIPVDRQGGLDTFFKLHSALYDPQKIAQAIGRVLKDAGKSEQSDDRKALRSTLAKLLDWFRDGGFPLLDKKTGGSSAKLNDQGRALTYKLMRSLLYAMFSEMVSKDGQTAGSSNEPDLLFFEDAMPALSVLAELNTPFYIQLQEMDYQPVVKLLISYKPGVPIFFVGGFLLLGGMSFRFFAYHRRIWLQIKTGDPTSLTMVGMSNRQRQRFGIEFNSLSASLQQHLDA